MLLFDVIISIKNTICFAREKLFKEKNLFLYNFNKISIYVNLEVLFDLRASFCENG